MHVASLPGPPEPEFFSPAAQAGGPADAVIRGGIGATIRGKIFAAFLVMSLITIAIGGQAVLGVRHAGDLVAETFDRSLMSINYARATAADFKAIETAFARRSSAEDGARREELDARIDALASSMHEDLEIAAARSRSPRAFAAAQQVGATLDAWLRERTAASLNHDWTELDRLAEQAGEQIDLLINYTAGDGFQHRRMARETIASETGLSAGGAACAVLLAAFVALQLARRIRDPVAAASAAAERIAQGDLDAPIPLGAADELGALLRAMAVMRDNIRAMMEREVAQRRSAQGRLVDAIESSREGVVLADRDGAIIIANSAASACFPGLTAYLRPGDCFDDLIRAAVREGVFAAEPGGSRATLAKFGPALPSAVEQKLSDGRWLRISRSRARDQGFVGICSDITALKQREAELEQTNLRFDAALSNMTQGLCLFDAANQLQVVNSRLCQLYRLDPAQLLPGTPLRRFLELCVAAGNHRQTVEELEAELAQRIATGERHSHSVELADGRVMAIAHEPLQDGGWVATHEDITERRRSEAQILFMARHDALTRLPNRARFTERMELAVSMLDRGAKFAVLCVDLDHFKPVNDTLGHPVGDSVLCAVATRLSGCVRESDMVARLGGDEFAVVQAEVEAPEDAAALARRLVDALAEPFDIDGNRIIIGGSVGVAIAPHDGDSVEALLKNADLALYRAKEDGRGSFRFFEADMDARLQHRRALELDLRLAVRSEAFELMYQPQFDFEANAISGFEALVRWRHPVRGLVSPAEFIPLAEETGLIVPIGEWVLKRAAAEAATWPSHVNVAVNVSPAQFASPRLVECVTEALSDSGIAARRLELEITESLLLQDDASTLDTLHALRGLGVRISMDDFGTGYSSLSYLRSFPFDKIKIDKSFIRDLPDSPDSGAIVRAITSLGRSMGMRTTAEGVETEEQFERLRETGCSEVQGYLLSRPAPASDVAGLLERWRGARAASSLECGVA